MWRKILSLGPTPNTSSIWNRNVLAFVPGIPVCLHSPLLLTHLSLKTLPEFTYSLICSRHQLIDAILKAQLLALVDIIFTAPHTSMHDERQTHKASVFLQYSAIYLGIHWALRLALIPPHASWKQKLFPSAQAQALSCKFVSMCIENEHANPCWT